MSLILEEITENTFEFQDITSFRILAGIENENLNYVSKILKLEIHSRGCEIKINGNKSNVEKASELLKEFYEMIKKGYHPKQKDFESGLNILESNQHNLEEIFLDTVCLTTDRKTIAPKSINQKLYIDSIRKNDLVFGIGPAGTGKTYLAVAMAVSYLNLKKVKRIILTRP